MSTQLPPATPLTEAHNSLQQFNSLRKLKTLMFIMWRIMMKLGGKGKLRRMSSQPSSLEESLTILSSTELVTMATPDEVEVVTTSAPLVIRNVRERDSDDSDARPAKKHKRT